MITDEKKSVQVSSVQDETWKLATVTWTKWIRRKRNKVNVRTRSVLDKKDKKRKIESDEVDESGDD